jgi:uncharacterized protein YbjT (DUF2867 family)
VAGRIVLFGAAGYTGRLTAEALVARGARPVPAARNVERPARARRRAVLATAHDSSGRQLAEVRVEGVNGYDFTGRILAWGAETAAAGGMNGRGALGPVEAFRLDELEAGCREAGIERV